jgi:hypothetical protein
VWKHLAGVPTVAKNSLQYCLQPLGKIQIRGEEAEVQLTGAALGARVKLIREDEQWVVDEVHLLSHAGQTETAELKQTMRMQVADGTIHNNFLPDRQPQFADRSAGVKSNIQQIGYETSAPIPPVTYPTTPTALPAETLHLDELPRVPVPSVSPGSVDPAGAVSDPPAEPIQAYGKLPHQRQTKRINPMAPIWKQ